MSEYGFLVLIGNGLYITAYSVDEAECIIEQLGREGWVQEQRGTEGSR